MFVGVWYKDSYFLVHSTFSNWFFGAGGWDCWLVKVDSSGNHQWNKTYGGTNRDLTYSVVQTGDEGYVIAGNTQSFGAGGYDVWLVKTDASRNMMWNKTYGRTNHDCVSSVVETSDGGYALAGLTRSFGAGNNDFWLIKLAGPQKARARHKR